MTRFINKQVVHKLLQMENIKNMNECIKGLQKLLGFVNSLRSDGSYESHSSVSINYKIDVNQFSLRFVQDGRKSSSHMDLLTTLQRNIRLVCYVMSKLVAVATNEIFRSKISLCA